MIPTMYLDREGVNVDTDADRTAFFISCLQYFHVLATAINTLYQNSYQGACRGQPHSPAPPPTRVRACRGQPHSPAPR